VSARTPEGRISDTIIRTLRSLPESHAVKRPGGPYGAAGEPDVDASVKGRAVKLEVKQPSSRKRLTHHQRRALRAWHRAGAVAAVVCSRDEALDVLAAAGLIDGRVVDTQEIARLTCFWLEDEDASDV